MAGSTLASLVPGYGYGETRKTLDTDRRVRDLLRIELGKGVLSMQEVVDVAQRANLRSTVEEAKRVKDEIEQFIDDIRTAPAALHRDVRKDEAETLVEFDTRVMRQCKEVVVAASLLHEKFLKSDPPDMIGEFPSVRKLVIDARGMYRDREAILKEVQGTEAYV
jgi:hypothetical protein